VQLAKDGFGLLKKKKKFYDFCVRCHIKTEESANQSKGCGALFALCGHGYILGVFIKGGFL
jgi:hypothetical protein